ncbi:nuclear transport factor 2 family protein [Rhizorhabdus argentea]|uniref:nuclear transport factor 2 family protein n=1 Tax=Rhizorhabdus argentea TaxID=1387174 RepID=UPI0030EF8130
MTIEDRLQRMEDIQEITRLKTRYTELADSSADKLHNGPQMGALFTEDAVFHIVATGAPPLIGSAAITERYNDDTLYPYSYHLLGNPHIEVSGDSGKGRWHAAVIFNKREVGSMWTTAFYEDEFVRTADGWRIKSLRCTASAFAPFGQGW